LGTDRGRTMDKVRPFQGRGEKKKKKKGGKGNTEPRRQDNPSGGPGVTNPPTGCKASGGARENPGRKRGHGPTVAKSKGPPGAPPRVQKRRWAGHGGPQGPDPPASPQVRFGGAPLARRGGDRSPPACDRPPPEKTQAGVGSRGGPGPARLFHGSTFRTGVQPRDGPRRNPVGARWVGGERDGRRP